MLFLFLVKKIVHLCKHLLHPLLVSLDVLHLPLQAVLHFVLDQVNADPGLSVLDTFIVDPVNREELKSRRKLYFCGFLPIPEWSLCFSNGMLQLRLGFLQQTVFPAKKRNFYKQTIFLQKRKFSQTDRFPSKKKFVH